MWGNVGKWGRNCLTLQPNYIIKDERMRFLGNIEAKIDVKGRAFLPAIFRKVLQQERYRKP